MKICDVLNLHITAWPHSLGSEEHGYLL